MNISERINTLLQFCNLKAGEFADSIDVAPATISNLKNGKTSLTASIAQKIVSAYPEVNFQWILLGEGPMLKDNENKIDSSNYPSNRPFSDELFPIESESKTEIIKSQPVQIEKKAIDLSAKPVITTRVSEETSRENAAVISTSSAPRTIEKIIIYYNDKTFEEYDMTKCKL